MQVRVKLVRTCRLALESLRAPLEIDSTWTGIGASCLQGGRLPFGICVCFRLRSVLFRVDMSNVEIFLSADECFVRWYRDPRRLADFGRDRVPPAAASESGLAKENASLATASEVTSTTARRQGRPSASENEVAKTRKASDDVDSLADLEDSLDVVRVSMVGGRLRFDVPGFTEEELPDESERTNIERRPGGMKLPSLSLRWPKFLSSKRWQRTVGSTSNASEEWARRSFVRSVRCGLAFLFSQDFSIVHCRCSLQIFLVLLSLCADLSYQIHCCFIFTNQCSKTQHHSETQLSYFFAHVVFASIPK